MAQVLRFGVQYSPPKLVAEVERVNGSRDLVKFDFREGWNIFDRRKLRSITQEIQDRLEVNQKAEVVGKSRRALSDAIQALVDRHRAKNAIEHGDDLNKAAPSVLKQAKAEMDTTFSKNVVRPGDPSYIYDRKVEFSHDEEDLSAASWDDDDEDDEDNNKDQEEE